MDPGLGDNLFESGADWSNPDDQMWYLPTGPAFLQTVNENSSVTMTDQGVNIGGYDLLDFMAADTTQFNNMEGAGY
jgi:hypothetical protein